MRVLFITPEIEDNKYRGVQFVVKQLVKALSKLGHHISFVTGYPEIKVKVKSSRLSERVHYTYVKKYFSDASELKKQIKQLPLIAIPLQILLTLFKKLVITRVDKNETSGINMLHYINDAINFPYVYKVLNVIPLFLKKIILDRLIKATKADLVIISNPVALPKLSNVKVAQIICDLIPFQLVNEPAYNNWLAKLAKRIDTATRNSDMILTISEDSAEKIRDIAPEAKVFNIGASISAYSEEIKHFDIESSILTRFKLEKDSFLLFISSVEKRKNLIRLIQSYISVADKLKLKLVILGNKNKGIVDDFKEIKKEAMRAPKHISMNIIFTGYASELDKYTLLQNARALVNPTLYEGFSLPVLEAFAFGCPVATSLSGATKEVAGDAVVAIDDPYSVSDITKALIVINTNPTLRQELIKKGKARAELYTEEVLRQKVDVAMNSLFGKEKTNTKSALKKA